MKVIVNKETIILPENSKVIDILEHLNYTKSVAIIINGEQLLLGEYDDFKLNENDNIRIIRPLGGG